VAVALAADAVGEVPEAGLALVTHTSVSVGLALALARLPLAGIVVGPDGITITSCARARDEDLVTESYTH